MIRCIIIFFLLGVITELCFFIHGLPKQIAKDISVDYYMLNKDVWECTRSDAQHPIDEKDTCITFNDRRHPND